MNSIISNPIKVTIGALLLAVFTAAGFSYSQLPLDSTYKFGSCAQGPRNTLTTSRLTRLRDEYICRTIPRS